MLIGSEFRLFGRHLIGNVLDNRCSLGKDGAVIESKGGNETKWIDCSVVLPGLHELRVLVDLRLLERKTGLVEDDVGKEGTCRRRIEKPHHGLLPSGNCFVATTFVPAGPLPSTLGTRPLVASPSTRGC